MDGNESDVDCGGPCDPCNPGQGCDGGTDCTTGFCSPSLACGLQEPIVWLDALDNTTLFTNGGCNNGPPDPAENIECWANKGSDGGLFYHESGHPIYREFVNGVEFSGQTMASDGDVFSGALGDVTVFLVQREVSSNNSFDFNLNHPSQDANRYSVHVPWGDGNRHIVFDIGGAGNAERIEIPARPISVGETHLFGFVNSARDARRAILIDGAEGASGVGALSSDAGAVSVGNGSRVVLHEFRVYAPSPNELQRQVIEGQLACRWELRDQLPATHPFHNADGASQAGCPPSL